MIRKHVVAAVALVALLSVPLVASAQDQVVRPASRSGFMMSGRLLTPWIPIVGGDTLLFFNNVVALPRFVIGGQIKDLGVGAGLNFFSWEDATLFLFGPTVTYAIVKGPGGHTALHLLGSFSFATGSYDPSVDVTALGFDFGVLGRAMLLDSFGLDVGLTFDFLSVTTDDGRDSNTNKGVQLVGFLGGTFIL